MTVHFPGVSSFVAAAKKPAAEKFKFSQVDHTLDYGSDACDMDRTDVIDDGSDEATPLTGLFIPEVAMALRPASKAKYTKIHKICKHRLFDPLGTDLNPEKVMTLSQLREIMTACLEGKKAKDDHCKQHGLHMVTLENYLLEFLAARYNSEHPTELMEWFTALSRAINKFGVFDSDICVFGKMLRNMMSETFPERQRVLHSTADRLMHESMSPSAWNNKMHDGVPFAAFEKAVKHMFSPKDAAEIIKRVKDPLPRTGKRGAANLEALERDHIRYLHGIEVLLTFNMNLMDDFLHDFVAAYREVDLGKDGVLTASEVSKLVDRFGTLEFVKEGSSAYLALQHAKSATLRKTSKARRLTFSQAVEGFMDLLSARFHVTGKKGNRYQQHDKLKRSLMQSSITEKSKDKAANEQVKAALKQITAEQKIVNKARKRASIETVQEAIRLSGKPPDRPRKSQRTKTTQEIAGVIHRLPREQRLPTKWLGFF